MDSGQPNCLKPDEYSDEDEDKSSIPIKRNEDGRYEINYSPTSRASCKTCHRKIDKGILRIGKMITIETGFYPRQGMGWWHMPCFFQQHSHKMTWKDFNGVEDLSVDDQKTLYQKACKCSMPSSLVEEIASTLETIRIQNNELQDKMKRDRQMALAEKKEKNNAHLDEIKNSSIEKLIREKIAKVIEKNTVEELKTIIRRNDLTVEIVSASKGKKKAAPKKADYFHTIINAKPLNKIGSLVHRAIRKHIKVDELKVLCQNVSLPKTGSKLDLTNRILEYLGGDFGEESAEEQKTRKRSYDDYKFSEYDIYEKDESHPEIVLKARDGDLDAIKSMLQKTNRPIATLNAARKWTEVEGKWGYDKSWEWHDETPLLAACRNRRVDVVHLLLSKEADPTLRGCIACDVTESPLSAVEKAIEALTLELNDARNGKFKSLFLFNATKLTRQLAEFQKIKQLLDVSLKFWDDASYASPSYSESRKVAFARNYNKPKNSAKLQRELSEISVNITIDASLEKEVDLCVKEARRKEGEKRAMELDMKRKEEEKALIAREKEREEQLRLVQQGRDEHTPAKKLKIEEMSVDSTSQHAPALVLAHSSTSTTITKQELVESGDVYEGVVVRWLGSYGFIRVNSSNFTSNLFIHVADVMTQRNQVCCEGAKLKFTVEPSTRKPGTMQAKKAVFV